ncbi:MAG TPA: CopD family protein, partial [Acidimicrobiales bacterium]|nr:CopD family protein [Acidimicrobiales bacterium]
DRHDFDRHDFDRHDFDRHDFDRHDLDRHDLDRHDRHSDGRAGPDPLGAHLLGQHGRGADDRHGRHDLGPADRGPTGFAPQVPILETPHAARPDVTSPGEPGDDRRGAGPGARSPNRRLLRDLDAPGLDDVLGPPRGRQPSSRADDDLWVTVPDRRIELRTAAGAALLAVGAAAALAGAVVVLVLVRWPSHPATSEAMAPLETPITRSLLADRVLSVVAWIENVATLFVLGGVFFRLFVSRPVMTGRRVSEKAMILAAAIGIVACLASLPLRAMVVSGAGLAGAADPEALGLVLSSRFSDAACVRLLALALFGFTLARPPAGWGRRVCVVRPSGTVVGVWSVSRQTLERALFVVAGLVALASFGLVGHPQASDPRGLLILTQSVHVSAAAVWFGGGVLLAIEVVTQRRRGTARCTAETVDRFSTLAGASVALVAASGVVLSWSQLASVSALWTSGYGRALAAKLSVVALVLVLGAYNHARLVPAIMRDDDATAWRRLGLTTAAEGVLVAAGVLVLTAAMTSGGF